MDATPATTSATAAAPPSGAATRRLVVHLLRPYRKWLTIVLIVMLIETAISLATPWPLKIVLDNVVGDHGLPPSLAWLHDTSLGQSKMGLAGFAAILTLLIALTGAIASYINNYYTESVGQWVANDLRMKVYHHLHRLSLAYYDTHQSGSLMSTITDDVATVQDFASSATMGILVDMLSIVSMLGLMFWLDWDFAMIAMGITPFLLFFVMRFKQAMKQAIHELRHRQSDVVGVVQQGLESIRAVKAYDRQELEEARLGKASRAAVEAALKARRVKSLLSPLVSITTAGCIALVLWRGAGQVLAGAMTVGALTVFLAYLNKFFKPVQDLAKMANTIAQAAVGLERIHAILETDTIIPVKPDAQRAESLRGDIVFENVVFAYGSRAPVLRDVNLSIKSGQRIGIVGPTGGGKSTMLNLIPRFYDPSGGRVLIDGVDVRDYALHGLGGLREQIGFVLQDTVLFHGTVRDNIAYGRPGATEAEIIQAAKLADADEFIMQMPDGYNTMVGERGLTLSGGQRQRLGIARAIVRNAPILILDEPTAALDTEAETLVMGALERLMKGRTVITIAHRLSTIRDSHKIVVLKGGVVAEEGTHAELIALNGVYAELVRGQSHSTPARAGA